MVKHHVSLGCSPQSDIAIRLSVSQPVKLRNKEYWNSPPIKLTLAAFILVGSLLCAACVARVCVFVCAAMQR